MQLVSTVVKTSALALIPLFWMTGTIYASELESCKQVGANSPDNGGPSRIDALKRPGHYCLREDVKIKRRYVPSEGGERATNGSVLQIYADDVWMDLQLHTLDADGLGANGVIGGMKRITLQNGTIKSRTGSAVQFGYLFGHDFGSIRSDFSLVFGRHEDMQQGDHSTSDRSVLAEEVTEPLSKLKLKFPDTALQLKGLTIDVGASETHPKRKVWQNGIAIKGAGNLIQNSTINVYEGHAGIYLFGPNQVIENNTIIFKGQPATPSGAPIKLHFADNSVIRNNKIIIEGGGDKPEAAISIIDSKNVVIENNKVIGTKTLYKIWDEGPDQTSSIVERGNAIASGLGRWFSW